ncbi:hypothetical protein SK128_027318 [Halocaridina rubra]|uniref:Uncharacterized protein n=1 Tax=Halocaridina rubra TaxID=373956 RepID=A0AAN8ZVF1_HALRR
MVCGFMGDSVNCQLLDVTISCTYINRNEDCPWNSRRVPAVFKEMADFMEELDKNLKYWVMKPDKTKRHSMRKLSFPYRRHWVKNTQEDTCKQDYCNRSLDKKNSCKCVSSARRDNDIIRNIFQSSQEPWKMDVNIKGCDEARSFVENGMVTVEGSGMNGTSKTMIRHSSSLPPNVDSSSLKAVRTKDKRLLITLNPKQQQIENRKELAIENEEIPAQVERQEETQNNDIQDNIQE